MTFTLGALVGAFLMFCVWVLCAFQGISVPRTLYAKRAKEAVLRWTPFFASERLAELCAEDTYTSVLALDPDQDESRARVRYANQEPEA